MKLTIPEHATVDYSNVHFHVIDPIFTLNSPYPISFDEILISKMGKGRVSMIDWALLLLQNTKPNFSIKRILCFENFFCKVTWSNEIVEVSLSCNRFLMNNGKNEYSFLFYQYLIYVIKWGGSLSLLFLKYRVDHKESPRSTSGSA